jgi:hypothetical protein
MLGPFCELTKNISGRACDPCATNVTARQRQVAIAQPQRHLSALDRLRETTLQDPFQIFFASVRWRWIWWKAQSVACFYRFHYWMPLLCREQIEQALPVSWNESVEVNQLRDPVASAISDSGGTIPP